MIFTKVFGHHKESEMVVVPDDFDCLRDLYYTYEEACGVFEDYSLKYVKHLVHACETESFSAILESKKSIIAICSEMELLQ